MDEWKCGFLFFYQVLSEIRSFLVGLQSEGSKYIITGARADDRGVYVCAAENPAGSGQASVVLEVEGREEPRLEVYPGTSQIVQPGQSAFFQCRVVAGTPQPTLSWTRGGGQPLTPNTNIADRPDVISFTDISATENGQYICSASNKFGTTSVTVDLQVQGITLFRKIFSTKF